MDQFDFSEKKIIVTGASSGVGRETAILLSRTGAKVVLIARREEELKRTLSVMEGNTHTYKVLDVSDFDGVVSAVKEIVAEDGKKIDYVAHCAGVVNPTPLRAITCQNIDQIVRTNFYSFVAILKCAATKRLFNDGGAIVGISSSDTLFGDVGNGVYIASKGAMNTFATCAAQELRPRKIRVNTICPYGIKTEMMVNLKFCTKFNEITRNNFPETFLDAKSVAAMIATLFSESMRCVSGVSILADGALVKSFGEI